MLRSLSHRVDFLAAMVYGQQDRRARKVLVQEIVMHNLVMPQPFSRRGVQREDAVREEVHPMAIASVKIGLGGLRRDVNDTALFIERLTAPRHGARGRFVGVLRPCVGSDFVGPRNQMKDPTLFARLHIEGTDGALATYAAEDQRVFVDDAGRIQSGAKIDRSVFAKTADDLAGLR